MINTRQNNRPLIIQSILMVMLLIFQSTTWATVTARIDRATIYEGESVTLRISSDGTASIQPDLSVLEKDFTIAGTSTSSQYNFINGQQSRSINWTILLEPRRKGNIRIPPITIGADVTPEFNVTIDEFPEELAASLADHLFIEVEVDVDRPIYVQQQIPYTLKFYYTDEIDNGDLNGPEMDNTVIEKLGKDKRYREVKNDRAYNVIERQYVISAEKSGTLTIPATTFKGHASVPYPDVDQNQYETLKNHGFFSIPPFSRRQSRIDRPVQTASEAYTIQILPRPGQPAANWLPAEALKLVDSWANRPPRMRTGVPVTRSITIQTKGLTGSQLPMLEMIEPQGARIYPESPKIKSQTDGETVYGNSTQSFTYIPSQAGILTVPEIKLEWWDIKENKRKTASLPKWEINVGKGTANQIHAQPTKPGAIKEPVSLTERNDQPVKNKLFTRDILITLLVIAFIVSGIFIINRRTRNVPTKSGDKSSLQKPSQEALLTALENDCTGNNPNQAARHLLQLAETLWTDVPPQTLGELASQVQVGKQTLLDLDQHLYGTTESTWNGSQLLALIKQGLRKKDLTQNRDSDILKPLYPQHR